MNTKNGTNDCHLNDPGVYDIYVGVLEPNNPFFYPNDTNTEFQNENNNNESHSNDINPEINADVALSVHAYVEPVVEAKKEAFSDKVLIYFPMYIAFASGVLTIAAIINIILAVSGVFRGVDSTSRYEYFRTIAIEVSGKDAFKVDSSPQLSALKWMLEQDKLILTFDKRRIIQRYISSVIYFSLGGPTWNHTHTFINGRKHECEWNEWEVLDDPFITDPIYSRGFHCRDNKTITDIQLYYINLTGTLPMELGKLPELVRLNLGGNPLIRSTIPSEIGMLKKLDELFLFENDIHGTIPNEIQNAIGISVVALHGNSELTDNIDPFCALPNLQWLQTDCGNGTSKSVCECCDVCCNPDLMECCFVGTTNCFSTNPNDEFKF